MQIVNQQVKYPPAPLIDPNTRGYIHLAFEVDDSKIPLYLFASRRKKNLLARAKVFAKTLETRSDVNTANVFRAVIRPPIKQPFLETVREKFHVARFDVAFLIETDNLKTAKSIRDSKNFKEFLDSMKELSDYNHVVVAENARRINEVDKSYQGVFLFNYFYSEDVSELLPVWEYTAGWFTKETKLDNSTLMLPAKGEKSQYGVINHCRWDSWLRLMPKLLFMKSMRTYVAANFEANKIAVMPILYKLA